MRLALMLGLIFALGGLTACQSELSTGAPRSPVAGASPTAHRPASPAQQEAARQAGQSLFAAALHTIRTTRRPGKIGFATIRDGNFYVQCGRWTADWKLRCEAAGARMQPTLAYVLKPDRITMFPRLGWRFDPAFGNYVQDFPAWMAPRVIAGHVVETLIRIYGADPITLQVKTAWVPDMPCPPRNGPDADLAGAVQKPSRLTNSIFACSYHRAKPAPRVAGTSTADLIAAYGAKVSAEIHRLRIRQFDNVFAVFDAGIGYVQCAPLTRPRPSVLYCEAQSIDEFPPLVRILTEKRIARLHALGFSNPGRAPNYWRTYRFNRNDDQTIADQLLTVLHDVYNYDGAWPLIFSTERGTEPGD